MKRLTDSEFKEALLAHVVANDGQYVSAIEIALRSQGIASSHNRIIDCIERRKSGLALEKCGKGQKVRLLPSQNGSLKEAVVNCSMASDEPATSPAATPPPRSRMAEFGQAMWLALAALPFGSKVSVTISLNEEAPF